MSVNINKKAAGDTMAQTAEVVSRLLALQASGAVSISLAKMIRETSEALDERAEELRYQHELEAASPSAVITRLAEVRPGHADRVISA